MGHCNPFFWTVYPIRSLNKKVSTFPVPVKVWHVSHKSQVLLPGNKMIYPLGRDGVLGFVAIEELVQQKLTVPTAQTTPQDLSAYKDPLGVRSDLADGQSHEISWLMVQGRQW